MQSSEILKYMKSIPGKDSSEYDIFWDNERKKAEYGITINGVKIPGWLYWHCGGLWNIYIDEEDAINKTIKRTFKHPEWRDNEWMIAEAYEQAQEEKKGLMIFGSRRLGKSEFLSSHLGRYSTLQQGSENIVGGGNWGDVDVIMYKTTQGLNALPQYFKFGRLAENLRKEIELGFKDKKGTRYSWSKIIARNHEEGNDSEVFAGLTATTFVLDEVGKSKFREVFSAAKPAFTSPYGWRCVPILTGTSGDILKNSDAQKFFEEPESNNFIVRELKEEGGKKVSLFISGLRRMEGKVKTTLANYIETEKGILIPKTSELHNIQFLNSDFTKAEAIIDNARELAAKSSDPKELLKETMYYPKNTKELFLVDDGNNFPIEAINEQIEYLKQNEQLQGQAVKLYKDVDNRVKISFNTSKKAIIEYPLKDSDKIDKDAAIIIYEPPIDNPPTYLYVSGADPYNQSASKWSTSLGSVYIYKRMYDPINGTFQNRIVASYTARPETLKEWHENVELLLDLYNCVCMPENEASTFIQYFDQKNKGHYLADGYNFLKEISPTTSITGRIKGLPATPKVQRYYKELVFQYCTEEVIISINDDGSLIKKLGVCRITDIGLLRELAAFNDKGNFDRYVAFGHTLAHEAWADKMYPYFETHNIKDKDIIIKDNKIHIKSPFNLTGGNAFKSLNSNPFGIKS